MNHCHNWSTIKMATDIISLHSQHASLQVSGIQSPTYRRILQVQPERRRRPAALAKPL